MCLLNRCSKEILLIDAYLSKKLLKEKQNVFIISFKADDKSGKPCCTNA